MASQFPTLASMRQPCEHNYTYAPNLVPDSALSVCAVCITEARIGEVKFATFALARRGGIFESSKAGPELRTNGIDDLGWMSHKDCTSRWKRAKLDCWRLVANLENLRDEQFDMAEEWGVDEALYIWELARDECWKVPGCQYLEYPASKEVDLTSRSPAIENVSEPTPQEEEDSDGSWEKVKRRWKRRSQQISFSDDNEPLDVDQMNLKEMEGVNNRLADARSTPRNRFDKIVKTSRSATTVAVAQAVSRSKGLLQGDTKQVRTSLSLPLVNLAADVLQQSASLPRKSVSINAQATILPCDYTPATTMSHHEHTVIERSRDRPTYSRSSRFYTPSCWASPEGYEKDDTSLSKSSWATVDQLQREFAGLEVDSEKKEEVLTERAEEAAAEQDKKANLRKVKDKAFRARRPPWQGERLFHDSWQGAELLHMRDYFKKALAEDANLSSLSQSHRKALARGLHDCGSALMQEEKQKEKKWVDAESER
ncbi:hypothetical protein J4E90_009559 [Alternaria incomplexa]|uniref:uncharacterized protein n=1 Tax=Alternaria incomplexa TaxID=1187928 RepID=UPI00221FB187|nr:uncharacterized protein J4E90_009559 [Alternaria incomplexa]KAI4907530.1 hypothetical protein J4E90_009559 [Alternaria incomplexa]